MLHPAISPDTTLRLVHSCVYARTSCWEWSIYMHTFLCSSECVYMHIAWNWIATLPPFYLSCTSPQYEQCMQCSNSQREPERYSINPQDKIILSVHGWIHVVTTCMKQDWNSAQLIEPYRKKIIKVHLQASFSAPLSMMLGTPMTTSTTTLTVVMTIIYNAHALNQRNLGPIERFNKYIVHELVYKVNTTLPYWYTRIAMQWNLL